MDTMSFKELLTRLKNNTLKSNTLDFKKITGLTWKRGELVKLQKAISKNKEVTVINNLWRAAACWGDATDLKLAEYFEYMDLIQQHIKTNKQNTEVVIEPVENEDTKNPQSLESESDSDTKPVVDFMRFEDLLKALKDNTLGSSEIDLGKIKGLKRTKNELVKLCKAISKNKEVRKIKGLAVDEWSEENVKDYKDFILYRILINRLHNEKLFLKSLQDNFNTFFMQPIVFGTWIGDYLKTPFQWLYDYVKDTGGVMEIDIELPSFCPATQEFSLSEPATEYSLKADVISYRVSQLTVYIVAMHYIVTQIGRSLGLIIGGLIGLVLSPFSFFKSIAYDYPIAQLKNKTQIAVATLKFNSLNVDMGTDGNGYDTDNESGLDDEYGADAENTADSDYDESGSDDESDLGGEEIQHKSKTNVKPAVNNRYRFSSLNNSYKDESDADTETNNFSSPLDQ